MEKLTRRDFLRLIGGLSGTTLLANLLPGISRITGGNQHLPNIVLLVCDAMTAVNLSLYGYGRKTTPNLERLAGRALVYHKHYANGNYTTPGASSLLTGLRPWTHRAINGSGIVKKELVAHNIFNFLGGDYFRLGFTQNYWAQYLLDQFSPDIDTLLSLSTFDLAGEGMADQAFGNDPLIARRSIERMFYYSNSLLLSFITGTYYQSKIRNIPQENYPFGLPTGNYFPHTYTLENLFNGMTQKIFELDVEKSPFFAYFHIYPPHFPYRPRQEFFDLFKGDGYKTVAKKRILSYDTTQAQLDIFRDQYDGYLAEIDLEIGRMIAILTERGVLDHTYFILTSDHGESFERGVSGHFTPLLYQPLIRIPLMIFGPGTQSRRDFFSPTHNIDILPTVLHLAGKEIPASCEGSLLPGLGGIQDFERTIVTLDAKQNPAFRALEMATFTLIKQNKKLIYYRGYRDVYQNYYEFFDLEQDPEELIDCKDERKYQTLFSDMRNELLTAIEIVNKPYI